MVATDTLGALMADIVSLRGHPIAAPGEPREEVIAILTEILEAAKSGNVTAMAVSYCQADETVSRAIVGQVESIATLRMIGSLSIQKAEIESLFVEHIAVDAG